MPRRPGTGSTPPPSPADRRVISIRGAREHNLKNVDLDIPRDKLVVFTGLVGLGQILARLRHDLCRGPAALCGEPVGLCAPVPGDDAEAGRRPDRRPVAGHLDRAEDDLAQPALDRRHGHRDLRLYAPALGARRHPLFAGHRPADREPDRQPDGRPRHGAARGHAALPAGAGGARAQGRVPQGARRVHEARLPARQDRRRRITRSPRRLRSTRSSSTTSTWWSTASWCAATSRRGSPIRFETALELADGIADRRTGRSRRRRTASRSASSSARNSPARFPASPFRRSSRGCSPSTIRSAPAPSATGSARR